MEDRLILKGEARPGRAFAQMLPVTVVCGIVAVFFLVVASRFDEEAALRIVGYRHWDQADMIAGLGQMVFVVLGIVAIALAVVLPFGVASDAKRCFVDVYEDRVRGGYREGTGKQTRFVPFELTYDMIQSVQARKNDVFIQVSGRTLQSKALNAADIAKAISYQVEAHRIPTSK